VEATIAILRGLQEKYELHHGVEITDPAIVAAAELSNRYITDRFLPDKAIDLIDEAAARIKMEIDSKPEVMDKLDRRLIQLKIEREAVQEGEGRGLAEAPGPDRGGDRAKLERSTPTSTRSGRPRRRGAGLALIKEEIDKLRAQMAELQRKGQFDKLAELQYGKLPQLEAQLKAGGRERATSGRAGREAGRKLLRTQVGAEEIAEVVSRATGIPVSKMMQGERDKLLKMEDKLHEARGRPGRGGAPGVRRHPPFARRACRTRTGPTAPSCSSARPAWARPSCARRWPSSCSTPRTT
jgi:ATP-dependent Clp protease ATP-binding subunit ClpB